MSSHLFAEASSHMLAVTPTAHWLEVLDLGRAILAEPIEIVDGAVTARGPVLGLQWDEAAVSNIWCERLEVLWRHRPRRRTIQYSAKLSPN